MEKWSIYYVDQDTVDVILGMAVRDNVDADSVEINAVIYYREM